MSPVKHTQKYAVIFSLTVLMGLAQALVSAAAQNVLVVMSYDEAYPWSQEIKQGIENELSSSNWTVKYVYLDTKKHLELGKEKAKDAYALYREFQPDAVIAADDNAQSLFVVPYLKDKVKTPVIFCGVNSEPDKYGYPASNVTGVLERPFIEESIAFLKDVVPDLTTISYLIKDSPTGELYSQQVQKDSNKYPIKSLAFKMPNTLQEALAMAEELKTQSNALFIMTVNGLADSSGQPLNDEEIVPQLVKAFEKPTCTDLEAYPKYGVLCAVAQSGQAQGSTAATMLKQVLGGTPLAELAITRNYWGKRILNVTALQQLGIKPQAHDLMGVELIKTTQ